MEGMPLDKGLYMPEYVPDHSRLLEGIDSLSFQDISYAIASSFLSEDFKNSQIEDIISGSISFDTPIVNIFDNVNILELFHGPTLAFKDFGARFMARTMENVVLGYNKEVNILVATSGDTGSAVAHGFYNVEGVNVIILYPSQKVSYIQEKQLTTLDKNIYALEIDGTFDDCQNLVKEAFADNKLKKSINLSSANSINIARLIPQSFYYFNAYAKLKSHKKIILSVPSGNFGNVTAGLMAKKMGLPIYQFIASTNANKTIPDYLDTNKFIPAKSVKTVSNAMDVGNPSNIRRIVDLYKNIDSLKNDFVSKSFDDDSTMRCVKEIFDKYSYTLDPHSAVGLAGLNYYLDSKDDYEGIFLGTAHPSKFSDIIEPIINTKVHIPKKLREIIDKDKKSTLLNNNYSDFSDYLISNFR